MRKYFLTGLVILLPVAVTVMIVAFIVNFLTQPFIGIAVDSLSSIKWGTSDLSTVISPKVIWYGSRILILVVLFLFTLLLGMLARWFFIRSLLKFSENILNRIPLVNKIYKTTQEIIKTFFSTDSKSFKKVVLVPFPSANTYCVGLVSREAPLLIEEQLGQKLTSVFIPTTPNPTSGFILMFKESDIIELPIKTEDALKFIVSCGVIHPDVLKTKKALPHKTRAPTVKKSPQSQMIADKPSPKQAVVPKAKSPSIKTKTAASQKKMTARAVKKTHKDT